MATRLPRRLEENMKIVGEQIKLARLRRNLSRAQVAERAMCSELTEARVVKVGSQYHTLLSNRFDRTSDGRRIHYASALTMLGLKDRADSEDGYGYLDIVDFIIRNCTDVEEIIKSVKERDINLL